jgi:hypothetical protein
MRWLLKSWAATLVGLLVCWMSGFAQDSLHVRRIAEILDPAASYGYGAWDVALQGDRAYVCAWGYGLWVIDISQEDSLREVGHFNPPC